MLDRDTPIFSVNDVINTLRKKEFDWNEDDVLAFASSLTGLSMDTLYGLMAPLVGDKELVENAYVGKKYVDTTFHLDWQCMEKSDTHIVLQNQPPLGAKVTIGDGSQIRLVFESI